MLDLCVASVAPAQDYPNRPIRLVVPFPPGGASDILGRLIAERLGAEYKQTVVVENRPGASGHVGAKQVAKSACDGPRREDPAHRAGCADLYETVDAMSAEGVRLLDTIDTYHELVDKRIPGDGESVGVLKKRKILIDGKADALLLQIFT